MNNAVLFADTNSRAAVACLRSLCRRGVGVYAATSSSDTPFVAYTSHSRRLKGLLQYRAADSKTLISSLLSIGRVIGSYVLFPSGEQILRWMIAERTALAAEGIVVPTVDLPTYERVSDKQSFVSLARKYGLATPMECDGIPSRFVRKFVVKPVQGIWGRSGILTSPVLVESEEGLRLLRRRSLSMEYHFVQEWVEGPSYYYCGLYVDGKKSLSFHQKTLTQQPAGRSVVRAIPALLPEIVVARIDAMMESLQWQGLMMIEVKESGGLYYAIECNPRLWGPMQLAVDNGIDFPYALWRMARGEAPETSPMPRRPVGYVWLTGYVRGWLLARETGTRFQRNSEGATQGLRFRDVWLRLDTLPYSVVELLRAVWAYVRGALERRSELGTLDEDGGLV